jgi:methylated-DNA-[protein]-cysteine S-methyltransferase
MSDSMPKPKRYTLLESPLGALLLVGDGQSLGGLYFEGHLRGPVIDRHWQRDEGAFTAASEQLGEYFAGRRRNFDVSMCLKGTPFQHRVWELLRQIPFGQWTTYSELARRLDAPSAVRAVGAAVGANPVSILVPCHRVLGSDGRLRGFAGGLQRKDWLLGHEQRATQSPGPGDSRGKGSTRVDTRRGAIFVTESQVRPGRKVMPIDPLRAGA